MLPGSTSPASPPPPPDKIRELAEGEPNPNKQLLAKYRLAPVGDLAKRRFKRIILDKAHLIKKIKRRMLQYLRIERYNAIWFVTASPIMNTAKDLVNTLELVWSTSGLY